jgi:hypothetical protein
MHWLAFAGGAYMLLLSVDRRREIGSAAALCLLAVSLEWLQHLIYRGPMEWQDVYDDNLAVLVTVGLYRLAGCSKLAFLTSRAPRARSHNIQS